MVEMTKDFSLMYNSFKSCAMRINNWEKLSKTDLANGYCDAEENNDEYLKEGYYCALLCRYWYMVTYMYERRADDTRTIEDFVGVLCDAIDVAFKYRGWRNPENNVYYDKDGAEKVINRVIYTRRINDFIYTTKDKRSANYNSISIDNLVEDLGYSSYNQQVNYSYKLPYALPETEESSKSLIKYYIKKKDFLPAIFIETICYGDIFTEKYKLNRTSLYNYISKLDAQTFINQYDINNNKKAFITSIENLKSMSKYKINQLYNIVVKKLSTDKNLKEILCL